MTNEEKQSADDFFTSQFCESASDHVKEAKRHLCWILNDFRSASEADRVIGLAIGQLEKAREKIAQIP